MIGLAGSSMPGPPTTFLLSAHLSDGQHVGIAGSAWQLGEGQKPPWMDMGGELIAALSAQDARFSHGP